MTQWRVQHPGAWGVTNKGEELQWHHRPRHAAASDWRSQTWRHRLSTNESLLWDFSKVLTELRNSHSDCTEVIRHNDTQLSPLSLLFFSCLLRLYLNNFSSSSVHGKRNTIFSPSSCISLSLLRSEIPVTAKSRVYWGHWRRDSLYVTRPRLKGNPLTQSWRKLMPLKFRSVGARKYCGWGCDLGSGGVARGRVRARKREWGRECPVELSTAAGFRDLPAAHGVLVKLVFKCLKLGGLKLLEPDESRWCKALNSARGMRTYIISQRNGQVAIIPCSVGIDRDMLEVSPAVSSSWYIEMMRCCIISG